MGAMCCIGLTESRLEVRWRMGMGELPLREVVDRVRERESIVRVGLAVDVDVDGGN